jgi:hypothetical protein
MSFPMNEAEDRVIARVLDLEDGDEAAMDRATLDEYRRVAAHLPFEEVAPAPELEDRVVAAALAVRPPAAHSIDARARRRATARWVTLGAAAAAAVAVVTFMFTTSDDTGTVGGRVDPIRTDFPVQELVGEPGTRDAELSSEGVGPDQPPAGRVALAPDGDGVLYDLNLPATMPGEVVWVWLVVEDEAVPIGAIRDSATEIVPFHVTGASSTVAGVAMSIEPTSERPDMPGPVVARADL